MRATVLLPGLLATEAGGQSSTSTSQPSATLGSAGQTSSARSTTRFGRRPPVDGSAKRPEAAVTAPPDRIVARSPAAPSRQFVGIPSDLPSAIAADLVDLVDVRLRHVGADLAEPALLRPERCVAAALQLPSQNRLDRQEDRGVDAF
jgi:hypothetical protein